MGGPDLVCVGQSYGYLSFGLELVSANQLREQGRQPKLDSPIARSCSQLSPSLRHNTSRSLTQTRYTKKRELKRAKLIFFSFFFFKIDQEEKKVKNLKKIF